MQYDYYATHGSGQFPPVQKQGFPPPPPPSRYTPAGANLYRAQMMVTPISTEAVFPGGGGRGGVARPATHHGYRFAGASSSLSSSSPAYADPYLMRSPRPTMYSTVTGAQGFRVIPNQMSTRNREIMARTLPAPRSGMGRGGGPGYGQPHRPFTPMDTLRAQAMHRSRRAADPTSDAGAVEWCGTAGDYVSLQLEPNPGSVTTRRGCFSRAAHLLAFVRGDAQPTVGVKGETDDIRALHDSVAASNRRQEKKTEDGGMEDGAKDTDLDEENAGADKQSPKKNESGKTQKEEEGEGSVGMAFLEAAHSRDWQMKSRYDRACVAFVQAQPGYLSSDDEAHRAERELTAKEKRKEKWKRDKKIQAKLAAHREKAARKKRLAAAKAKKEAEAEEARLHAQKELEKGHRILAMKRLERKRRAKAKRDAAIAEEEFKQRELKDGEEEKKKRRYFRHVRQVRRKKEQYHKLRDEETKKHKHHMHQLEKQMAKIRAYLLKIRTERSMLEHEAESFFIDKQLALEVLQHQEASIAALKEVEDRTEAMARQHWERVENNPDLMDTKDAKALAIRQTRLPGSSPPSSRPGTVPSAGPTSSLDVRTANVRPPSSPNRSQSESTRPGSPPPLPSPSRSDPTGPGRRQSSGEEIAERDAPKEQKRRPLTRNGVRLRRVKRKTKEGPPIPEPALRNVKPRTWTDTLHWSEAVTQACMEGNVSQLLEEIEENSCGWEEQVYYLNRVDSDGDSMLLYAMHNGHYRVLRILLERGVDVNSVDVDGDTCLHLACKMHRMDIMKLFLRHGADPTIVNKANQLPWQRTPHKADMERWQTFYRILEAEYKNGARSLDDIDVRKVKLFPQHLSRGEEKELVFRLEEMKAEREGAVVAHHHKFKHEIPHYLHVSESESEEEPTHDEQGNKIIRAKVQDGRKSAKKKRDPNAPSPAAFGKPTEPLSEAERAKLRQRQTSVFGNSGGSVFGKPREKPKKTPIFPVFHEDLIEDMEKKGAKSIPARLKETAQLVKLRLAERKAKEDAEAKRAAKRAAKAGDSPKSGPRPLSARSTGSAGSGAPEYSPTPSPKSPSSDGLASKSGSVRAGTKVPAKEGETDVTKGKDGGGSAEPAKKTGKKKSKKGKGGKKASESEGTDKNDAAGSEETVAKASEAEASSDTQEKNEKTEDTNADALADGGAADVDESALDFDLGDLDDLGI